MSTALINENSTAFPFVVNGEPLVFYHYSSAAFTKFDPAFLGGTEDAFFFYGRRIPNLNEGPYGIIEHRAHITATKVAMEDMFGLPYRHKTIVEMIRSAKEQGAEVLAIRNLIDMGMKETQYLVFDAAHITHLGFLKPNTDVPKNPRKR